MKFYKVDELFIGYGGYSTLAKDNSQFKFTPIDLRIAKIHDYESYEDIFSKKIYREINKFQTHYDVINYAVILNLQPLSAFIYEMHQKIQNVEIINKIYERSLKIRKVSDKDLKKFIYYINSQLLKNNDNEQVNQNDFDKPNTEPQNNQDENFTFITTLTDKNFKINPSIGRDNEVNEVIITLAQDKKSPILVGPSGCGKTTIVDELAYRIQKNKVPKFLKNRKILELDLTNLLSDTKYSGVLESKVTKIIDYAVKNDTIIFIDEIHTIYGAGTHNKSDYDVAAMLKQAIDRKGLKVIGTTTIEEYNKYFSTDALKRRFEKIKVEEPTDEMLYLIINKVFNDYGRNNKIKLLDNMDNVITTLINITGSKKRTIDDKVCNPDLVIGIIDRIFADAKIHDQDKLTMYNIIYGIKSCNRIYDSVKEHAINNLHIKEKSHEKQKVIEFNTLKKN